MATSTSMHRLLLRTAQRMPRHCRNLQANTAHDMCPPLLSAVPEQPPSLQSKANQKIHRCRKYAPLYTLLFQDSGL